QLQMIDAKGRSAAYTGRACIEWCGDRAGDGYSIAGNMLVGPQVLAETAAAYERTSGLPFAERLLAALEAGDAAGGATRGGHARATIGGDRDRNDGGLSEPEPARRRSREPVHGAAAALRKKPRALPAVRRVPAFARGSHGNHRSGGDRGARRGVSVCE